MGCNHNCAECSSCSSCSGCANELTLTKAEIEMLSRFAQIPFWPIARKADSMTPVFLEDSLHTPEEYGLILECMEKKGLISLDYYQPLTNYHNPAYDAYPIQGSMALTARGIRVLELLELQGAEDES